MPVDAVLQRSVITSAAEALEAIGRRKVIFRLHPVKLRADAIKRLLRLIGRALPVGGEPELPAGFVIIEVLDAVNGVAGADMVFLFILPLRRIV